MEIDAMNPFFDCFGNPLQEGDIVAYPAMYGSSVRMEIGTLEKVIVLEKPASVKKNNFQLDQLVEGPPWRARIRPSKAKWGINATPRAVSITAVDNLVKMIPGTIVEPVTVEDES